MLSTLSLKEVLKVYAESETFQTTAKSTGEYEKKAPGFARQFANVFQESIARFGYRSTLPLNKRGHSQQSVVE